MSLVLDGGDIHIPFMHKKTVRQFIREIKEMAPDWVVFKGDLIDFTGLYKAAQVHHGINPYKEVLRAQDFLQEVSDTAPKSTRIVWLEGNHDERPLKSVARKIPQLKEMADEYLTVRHMLGLEELGIEWVDAWGDLQIDGVHYFHGETARKWAGQSVMAHMVKYGCDVSVGHCHRLATVHLRQGGRVLKGMESGCMCTDEAARNYVRKPDWQRGYVIWENGEPYEILTDKRS